MRYIVRHHQVSREWLVFNVDDQLELVAIHATEDEAMLHARKLDERDRRRQRFARTPALSAA